MKGMGRGRWKWNTKGSQRTFPTTIKKTFDLTWPFNFTPLKLEEKKKISLDLEVTHLCVWFWVFLFVCFVFLPFLGPLPWHMEIPRLGVEL